MVNFSRRKGPQELAELVREHNPRASLETITNVISEWGDVVDDKQLSDFNSINIESALPNAKHLKVPVQKAASSLVSTP